MTVYRNAGHCIARIMSIETNTCTPQSAWQRRYQSGFPETVEGTSGLTQEERLTQDSMTRSLVRRQLSVQHWHALIAKYSINQGEVNWSCDWLGGWLCRQLGDRYSRQFIEMAVYTWANPAKRNPEAERQGVYDPARWDDGIGQSTAYERRRAVQKELGGLIDEAHATVTALLVLHGLRLGGTAC